MTAYEVRIIDWSSDVCSSDLLHRIFDPDPDRVEPRGRTRFPGAEPYPCGQVLCAAAGAATVQAIADGRGLRPLFPDRAVFRLEESRVGKECVSTCRSWRSLCH